MINIQNIKANIIYLIPITAVILQGCYFNYQSSILAILFLLIILLNLRNNCYIEKTSIYYFLLIAFGFLLSDILNGRNYNFVFETTRFLCLILPIFLSYENSKRKLILGTYIASTIMSFLGILAYIKILPASEWAANIDGNFRLQSTIGYANTTAVICGIGVLLGFYFRGKNKNLEFVNSIMVFINLLAMICTHSRLGIACFIIAIMVALSVRFKTVRIVSFISVILGLAGVYILFKTGHESIVMGSSLVSRLIYWQDAFNLLIKNPLGIGVYAWEYKQYLIQTMGYYVKYVHNGFLQIALDGGILALVGFCLLNIIGIKGVYKKYKSTGDSLYLIIIAIIVLVLTHGMVDLDLGYTAILLVLGIALSFGFNENELRRKKEISCLLILLIILITAFQFLPKSSNYIEYVKNSYNNAYEKKDINNMYKYSQMWVNYAPRQQNANDAYFVALSKMYEITGDEKYIVLKNKLREKVADLNKTANPLTKYYDSYTNIFLPN